MARHNWVLLYGYAVKDPMILKDPSSGEPLRGTCVITTMRSARKSGLVENETLQYDSILVMSSDQGQMEKMSGMKALDMVFVKGVVSTRNVTKRTRCVRCTGTNDVKSMVTYVSPVFMEKLSHAGTAWEAQGMMRERIEISNEICIAGNLCNAPDYFEEGRLMNAQYQVAVNRSLRIKEDGPDKKCDYPWVKSYGEQARTDGMRLKRGSIALVRGRLQLREVVRATCCAHCGTEYKWKDSTMEIVSYATEYLENCNPGEGGMGENPAGPLYGYTGIH